VDAVVDLDDARREADVLSAIRASWSRRDPASHGEIDECVVGRALKLAASERGGMRTSATL